MSSEKIVIGADHAGYKLKEIIKEYIKDLGYFIEDIGAYNEDSVDYPIIARQASQLIIDEKFTKGILICGSGIGMSIAANKVKGIRAVVCSDTTSAKFSRLHNDSNVLCFGQRIVGEYLAKDICKIWLETKFEAQRHARRISLIEP